MGEGAAESCSPRRVNVKSGWKSCDAVSRVRRHVEENHSGGGHKGNVSRLGPIGYGIFADMDGVLYSLREGQAPSESWYGAPWVDGVCDRPMDGQFTNTYRTVFGSERHYLTNILSSVTAGGCSTICTNPIWVVKTRLMSQASSKSSTASSPYHYRNSFDAAKKMYLHEGIRSFYSGLAPALLGLTHVAVQFPLYEYFKGIFTGGVELGQQGEGGKTNYVGVLMASCLSKVCASSATYPHEVLRTRLQTQRILNEHTSKSGLSRDTSFPRYRGVIHSVATIYKEEGWRAFYAGMGTNMIRAVPSSAMTLLTYECECLVPSSW